jgi:hypothetical protein
MATSTRPEVSGDIAHDSPNTTTSFPVKIGGIAKNYDGTDPGVVAEDDAVDARFDRQGAQFVNIGNPYSFFTSTASGGSTAGAGLVAGVAGMSIYITDILLSALTAGTFVLREDTTTVTYLSMDFYGVLTAGQSGGHVNHSFRSPIKISAGKPLQYTASDKILVNIGGYYAP